MENDVEERCLLCSFWSGSRCTQTWRLTILVEPQEGGIGGQVDFMTAPGMVPEGLKGKLTEYMHKFMNKVLPVISMMPVWEEVRTYQLANPDRSECPAKEVRNDLKPYLHIVRTDI